MSERPETAHKDGLGPGILFGVVLGTLAMTLAVQWSRHQKLTACARQHNVYACHMVAVPTPTEDETWEKVSDGVRDIFGAISEATQKDDAK